jgi:hypothetical protein
MRRGCGTPRDWAISPFCSSTRAATSTCSKLLPPRTGCRLANPARSPSGAWTWVRTTPLVQVRPSTRRPKRCIERASGSCARRWNRPRPGRTWSGRRGRRRSWTSSRASWPGRWDSALAIGRWHPRPNVPARTSGARSTRPWVGSPRFFPNSARISSVPSTPVHGAPTVLSQSQRSRCCWCLRDRRRASRPRAS